MRPMYKRISSKVVLLENTKEHTLEKSHMIAYNVVKHNLNWEKIWPRITFKYINFQERDVIFKGGGGA